MTKHIVGRVDSLTQARKLVTALERESFGTDEITVLYPDGSSSTALGEELERIEVQGRGALRGALIGAALGLAGGLAAALVLEAKPLAQAGPWLSGFVALAVGALWGSIAGMALGKAKGPPRDQRDPDAIVVDLELTNEARLDAARALFAGHGAFRIQTRPS